MAQTATAAYPVTSGFAFPSNDAVVSGPGPSRYGLAVADEGRSLPPPTFPEDKVRLRTLTGPTPPSNRSKNRDLPPLPARVPTVAPTAAPGRPTATRNFSRPNVQPLQSFVPNAGGTSRRDGHRARSFSFDSESGASSARPPSLSFSNERESDGHADSPITPHRPGGFDDAAQASAAPSFLHAPPSAAAFPYGKENKPAAGAGVVSRLRHAASASNIGRGLTKKGKIPASSANGSSGFEADESFLPGWSGGDSDAASISASSRHPSQTHAPQHSTHSQQSSQYLQSPERGGLLRGRKSSFQGLRSASGGASVSFQESSIATDGAKKAKGGFWGSLWNKQEREKEPLSAPPTKTEFPDIPRASNVGGPRPSMQELGRTSSKADRLLGFDEAERQRFMITQEQEEQEQNAKSSKLAKAHDLLAEFLPSPSKRQLELHEATHPAMTRSESNSRQYRADTTSPRQVTQHIHNVSIASSKDSFATASTESRVAEVPPTLDTTIKFAERELSDDIEAVLRSQRDSMQGVDNILTLHHAINAKRSSYSSDKAASHRRGPSAGALSAASAPTTPASGTVALPAAGRAEPARTQTKSRHSPHNSGSFLALRPGHAPSSSTSSSDYSVSDRNRSISIHSQSGRSLRWADEEPTNRADAGPRSLQMSTLGDVPVRRAPAARSHGMERLFSEPIHGQGRIDPDQFEDAEEDGREQSKQPAHPFAFQKARPPLRSAKTAGEGETLTARRAASHTQMQRAYSNSGVPSASSAPSNTAQRRAAETLSNLPPLSTLLDACVLAAKSASRNPWQDLVSRPLTVTAPKDLIPSSWTGFVRAYARGDVDITSPPQPQSLLPPSAARSRMQSLGAASLDSPALQSEASFDFAFPLPPSRQGNQGMPVNHGGVATALEAAYDSPALSSNDEGTMPDPAIGAEAGVLGDMKAPRPPYEAERQQIALQYLSALGLDGPDLSEKALHYCNAKLVTIVERLATLLRAAEASIQFICDDEVITLARAGQLSGSYEDEMLRTPRAGDSSMGALGLDPFHDAQGGRSGSVVRLRDNSLDAHAILSRHGTPVSFLDIPSDWRFSSRGERNGAFFAAKTILSAEGLPLGTVSLRDRESRLEGLSRQEMAHLVAAATEVTEELERVRRVNLSNRLAMLDETLAAWCTQDHSGRNPGASTETPQQSIESTLLSAPAAPGLGDGLSGKAPPSPGTLAQRRGLKVPRSLAVPTSAGAQHPQMPSLQAALRIIVSALRMDLAYIAQVGSQNAAGPHARGSGNVSCSTLTRYDASTTSSAAELRLDGPLHLCALAATKRGLHLQQDPARVSQLLGTGAGSADNGLGLTVASGALNQDPARRDVFHTAVVVNCGFKEAGKSWKGSEGWVLAVASRLPTMRLSPECTIYLLRFAGLLAPMLLDGPRSPGLKMRGVSSPRSASRGSAYDDDSPKSPGSGSMRSQSRSRPRSRSRGPSPGPNRRVLPPTSPPPNEPLPMLPNTPSPLIVARPLPTVGGAEPSRVPPPQPALPPKNRLRSAASSPAMRGRGLPSSNASQAARSPASTMKGLPSEADADAEDAGTVDYLVSHLSMASSASGEGSRGVRPGHRQGAGSIDSMADAPSGSGWHSHSHTPSYSTTSGGHGYSTSFSSAYAGSEESNGATGSSAHRSQGQGLAHAGQHARTPSSLSGNGEVVSQRQMLHQQARQRLLSQAQQHQQHQQKASLQGSEGFHYP